MELGDMFNHELWQRVMVAVQELELAQRANGDRLN